MSHDPFPLQNLDKNRPKSSQNFTPILWLVQITTHYKEQLLQNQGEFMVKKGPLESEKGPRGPEKGLLRSQGQLLTVNSAYFSAYCNNVIISVQQLLIFIQFGLYEFHFELYLALKKPKNVTFLEQKNCKQNLWHQILVYFSKIKV